VQLDSEDLKAFYAELGITGLEVDVPFVRQQGEDVYIGPSTIHGKGVFSGKDFDQGERICLLHSMFWTESGRFMNHQIEPNAVWQSAYAVATKPIHRHDEITINYRQVKEMQWQR
jgi:hypothetical protein